MIYIIKAKEYNTNRFRPENMKFYVDGSKKLRQTGYVVIFDDESAQWFPNRQQALKVRHDGGTDKVLFKIPSERKRPTDEA